MPPPDRPPGATQSVVVPSPLGPLALTERDGAIVAVAFRPDAATTEPTTPVLTEAARELTAYFAGAGTGFTVPLAPWGTVFQRRVWDALLAIPPGQVRTYGALAAEIGGSARAVGGACGKNPIPILIPCHRVVAASGKTGGYSGHLGPETKLRLLTLEQARLV